MVSGAVKLMVFKVVFPICSEAYRVYTRWIGLGGSDTSIAVIVLSVMKCTKWCGLIFGIFAGEQLRMG